MADKKKRKVEYKQLEDGRWVMKYEGDTNWVVCNEDDLTEKEKSDGS